MTRRHRKRIHHWLTRKNERQTKRTELRGYLHKPRFEPLEDRRLLALDFGDAPDSIVGTSPRGAFDVASDFRISEQTPDDNSSFQASNPDIALNSTRNEYLVVWQGTRSVDVTSDVELEIYGQIIDADDGSVIVDDFKISTQGADDDADFDASDAKVVYNSTSNEYLVVWEGDRIIGEDEIYGQRVDFDGTLVGANFKISSQAPDGDTSFDAINPAVAHSTLTNEYLVVWEGEAAVVNEDEVSGQRVAADGTLVGSNFQISDQGTPGNDAFDAEDPDVAYNSTDHEFFVVWQGDRIPGEDETFGQRVTTTGTLVGSNFRISTQGPDGNTSYDADDPAVAWNPADNEYLVVWNGDLNVIGNEEVFGQRVDADGTLLLNNFRISAQSPADETSLDTFRPDVVFNSIGNEYFVVWYGDRVDSGTEYEVFGRRVEPGGTLPDDPIRISEQGGDGTNGFFVSNPAVAFSPTSSEFLPVWGGTRTLVGGTSQEDEIYGQRLEFRNTADYETLLSENGPRHTTTATLFLGAGIPDDEADGQPTVAADGDDSDAGGDDEDGVSNPAQLTMIEGFAPSIDLTVSNTTGSAASLYGWIDFNGDGVFDDNLATEKAVVSAVTGVNTLVFPVIPPGSASSTYARFRVSTDGAASFPTGGAADGEVEDYAVSILIAEIDVEGNGVGITNGDDTPDLADHTNFGPIDVFGAMVTRTFTIINNGTAVLDLGASAVSLSGDHVSDYTITAQPATTVAVGSSETFQIELDPSATGDRNATVSINNNDPDESPFTFDISGTGVEFLDFGDGPDAQPGTLPVGIAEIGAEFRISDTGLDTNDSVDGLNASIAYNFDDNEYLIVWEADPNNNESEVFGQIVDFDGTVIVDDFQISIQGPGGDTSFDARDPEVAYDSSAGEYLVVWSGERTITEFMGSTFDEDEVYGQRVDADGTLLGSNIRISTQGADGDPDFDAQDPSIAFNSADNEFLVIWEGTQSRTGTSTGLNLSQEVEIYAQRIDSGGALDGGNFRISVQGTDGDVQFDAEDPDVVYNSSADNEFLVVWSGDRIDNEDEIFGQRVNGDGTLDGANFRISTQGADGDTNLDAIRPALAYNPNDNEFLVVWDGDDVAGGLVNGEQEIYGQVVENTGALQGSNFRISFQGLDGDSGIFATEPDVAHTSDRNEYIVVWEGDESAGVVINNETEIWAQRIQPLGSPLGNRLQASQQGEESNQNFDAFDPSIAFNQFNNEFMIVWEGDIDSNSGHDEIHAQRVEFAGTADLITLLAEGGPRHAIDPNIRLGSQVDAELDAFVSPAADGDDNDPPDDEDGVVDPVGDLTLVKGQVPEIDVLVTNNTGSTATLYAWIDYDADGEFEDVGEKATATVLTGATDDTVTLTFPTVPNNAFESTFLRLRFSTDPAADSQVGRANDGEVEDYAVIVVDGDLGDAPTSTQSGFAQNYPTRLVDGGAIHKPLGPTLGAERDTEPNGQPNAGALGDDGAGAPDDEDGVTFVSTTLITTPVAAGTGQVQVDLQNADASSNKLDAWIDFNRDGDWTDAGEQIFTDLELGTANGIQTLNFTIPQDTGANIDAGQTFARFRLSTDGGHVPGGFAADGEVEDHAITLVGAVDFGDAPDTGAGTGSGNYNTLSTDSGPSHTLAAGLSIGAVVDDETEAFPSALADGDDADTSDDEDAFASTILIEPGSTPTLNVSVTNTNNLAATLYGWIDYDGNGLFDNTTEFASVAAASSGSFALNFPMVPGTFATSTFARFRLSTDVAAANPTGFASDGEVEDHLVSITEPNRVDLAVSAGTGTEDAGTIITVTVTAHDPVVGDQTVSIAASGPGITAGDYLMPNQVTILDGQSSGSVTFTVVDDDVVEPIDTATLTISNPSAGIILGQDLTADIQIINNDSANVAVTGVTKDEGTAGSPTTFTFTVSLSAIVEAAVSMTAGTIDGTAIAGSDYTAVSGASVNFAPGATTAQVDVDVTADSTFEADEAFDLALTDLMAGGLPVNFLGGGTTETATAVIVNDDFVPGSPGPILHNQSAAGFGTLGTWVTVPNKPDLVDGDFLYSLPGGGENVAGWSFDPVTPGQYLISASYRAFTNRATNAPFSIRDTGTFLTKVLVNQQQAPNDRTDSSVKYRDLATLNIVGTRLDISVSNDADGVVAIDAIRIERIGDVIPGPEVHVTVDGAVLDDDTGVVDFGDVEDDQSLSKVFTVTNLGTVDLTLTEPITVPTGFSLRQSFGQTTLAPLESTTFEIGAVTTTLGSQSGSVSFANNDIDDIENPFNFTIQSNIIPDTGIQIIDNGETGYNKLGSWTFVTGNGKGHKNDFEWANTGTGANTATWTFDVTPGQYQVAASWKELANRTTAAPYTIFNDTFPILTTTADQTVAASGVTDEGTAFKILGAFNISSNKLVVTLSDNAAGLVVADAIRIERLGDIPIGSEIVVTNSGSDVPDGGGVVDFGDVETGATAITTLTVHNFGTLDLTLGSVGAMTGFNATNFASTTVAPNQSTTFDVQIDTSTITALSDTLTFTNNDADESPFEFTVQGNVTPVSTVRIIDNESLGSEFTTTGTWTHLFTNNGYEDDFHWAYGDATPTSTATWTFDISLSGPGTYRVWITWKTHNNRATDATYTLNDDSTSSIVVNQLNAPNIANNGVTESGKVFEEFGTFQFNGTTAQFTLTNQANGLVIADAIRIERIL